MTPQLATRNSQLATRNPKLLIANRGEIAVRIIRACREMNIRTVAVYSEADVHAQHVREADEAVLIGPPPPAESYLRIDRLIEAAHKTGAQAIHPGYGFLSEKAEFAEAVTQAGLIFVGPSAESIRRMGSKTEARALMQAAGVPIVPGYQLPSPSGRRAGGEGEIWAFQQAAEAIGYPVLVKAAGGGGGRGMRVVAGAVDLAGALTSAQSEAASAFGDARVFLEKYIARARHIEFQIFGDAHGNVIHLFERECSVQRRHQKVIEESPSPLLEQHPELRERMGTAAVAAARAVNYQNAGTVEFIVDPDTLQFYFLEMNTRLQVEHPVTEAITGLDLVKLQLRVAMGEPLTAYFSPLTSRGHAIEARVYAEDPANNFYPSVGPILKMVKPEAPDVRVDSGFESGDGVSPFYDAILAKVIAHAATRAEAIAKLDAALARYTVLGLTTNIPFLRALLAHAEFQNGTATTGFIAAHFAEWKPPQAAPPAEAFIAAALHDFMAAQNQHPSAVMSETDTSPWARADGFRMGV
jgi:3-methylcrotonyl-CoA carboxylase alpha subunit